MEVVGDLRQDPRPVDAVNGCDAEGRVGVGVSEERFEDVLRNRLC